MRTRAGVFIPWWLWLLFLPFIVAFWAVAIVVGTAIAIVMLIVVLVKRR